MRCYSWSIYVPSAPNAMTGWDREWNLIAQWSPVNFASLTGCSPPIELDIKPLDGVPHLVFRRNDQGIGGTACGPDTAGRTYELGTLVYDQRIDLTVHVGYGTSPATGYAEIWANGT